VRSEPVAAVGHHQLKMPMGMVPAAPYDGQGEIRYQSQRSEGNPETLRCILILAAQLACGAVREQISKKNHMADVRLLTRISHRHALNSGEARQRRQRIDQASESDRKDPCGPVACGPAGVV